MRAPWLSGQNLTKDHWIWIPIGAPNPPHYCPILVPNLGRDCKKFLWITMVPWLGLTNIYCLYAGDHENGTCKNMDRSCFVYYKGNICHQNELSTKITEQKNECNTISFHSAVSTIQFRYHLINNSINDDFPTFQMVYKSIKCGKLHDSYSIINISELQQVKTAFT